MLFRSVALYSLFSASYSPCSEEYFLLLTQLVRVMAEAAMAMINPRDFIVSENLINKLVIINNRHCISVLLKGGA